jgi:hypothetical protein
MRLEPAGGILLGASTAVPVVVEGARALGLIEVLA